MRVLRVFTLIELLCVPTNSLCVIIMCSCRLTVCDYYVFLQVHLYETDPCSCGFTTLQQVGLFSMHKNVEISLKYVGNSIFDVEQDVGKRVERNTLRDLFSTRY